MALNWKGIRDEYEKGTTDTTILAKMFGVSSRTISSRIKKEQWEEQTENAQTEKLIENTQPDEHTSRVRILKAIQDSALKGIEKADSMLNGCESLKDLEMHSKTVKAYRDVLTKPEEIIGKATPLSQEDIYDFEIEDAARVLKDNEEV